MIPVHSKIGQEMRMNSEKRVNWYGRTQLHEESGHAVLQKLACCLCRRTGSWWTTQEEERERTIPIVVFEYRFMTREHAHTLPVLIGQTGATCSERKCPTSYSISFLVDFIKDRGFRRVCHPEMCYMNRARNHFKDAVIQACAGEDLFPQGPT